ncbi:MAG: hypothetical protein HC822_28360, partial [Oscillochloris sp.]|nr:hypothetical protein [Oscillochloris sp.]
MAGETHDPPRIRVAVPLSRRQFLRGLGIGASASVGAAVLAACGGAPAAAPTAVPAPTEPPRRDSD